jgi:pilus assembly protein TadC
LLAACLRSGLPVPTALRSAAEGAPLPGGDILRSTATLLALGANPRNAWVSARGCVDTADFARLAVRTSRSGAALAGRSVELAEGIRERLANQAEARSQRAGVLIAAPLALCFLPAFLCLGIIPIFVGLVGKFHFLS